MNDPVAEIERLFSKYGETAYLGENVSQQQHALQCAQLAVANDASQTLAIAALLHDIGHLLLLPEVEHWSKPELQHDRVAGQWLSRYFPEEVSEPVRLHVEAKRYLCANNNRYRSGLSSASQLSLETQGGPMNEAEMENFRQNSHWRDALSLRLWDDEAKDPSATPPELSKYIPELRTFGALGPRESD